MRLLLALFLLVPGMVLVPLGGAVPRAEVMPKAVVAVLDYAQILKTSDAAKDIRRQVQVYRDGFRDAIQDEERRLRQVEAELKRQRSALSPEEFEKQRQEFKGQVIAAQRRAQGFKQQLDRALKSAMNEVQQAVIPIVKKLTEKRGYTIVVDKSQVLFADRALDITNDVIVQLNQTMSTVTVPKPQ